MWCPLFHRLLEFVQLLFIQMDKPFSVDWMMAWRFFILSLWLTIQLRCYPESKRSWIITQVYSWEPVICRDSVEMGWSTLGDFCINENKFVGCSYYRNSVGIWVSDISVCHLLHMSISSVKDESWTFLKLFVLVCSRNLSHWSSIWGWEWMHSEKIECLGWPIVLENG